ncbi:MAG: type IV pilus secretin PilQ [Syntrophobacteraceae bacterium]
MRRQAKDWIGTFPLILGLTLFLGCFLHSRAACSQTGFQPGMYGQTETPNGIVKKFTGKKISLDLMDADIRNVLRLLSQLTSTNIVVDPDVSGKVTLRVKNVPWDQVLAMVLSMNNLGMEQHGDVIVISKEEKLQKEYQQKLAAIQAKQKFDQTAKDTGDLVTVYFPVNFGTPADLASKISAEKSTNGKVSVDKRTSLIIYTDYPARITAARSMLERLDRPTPQVLIEARIITISSDANRSLGVKFSFDASPTSSTTNPANGQPVGQSYIVNPPDQNVFNQFESTISQVIGKTLLYVDFQINALQTLNLARIVAAPRVLTLDNVKASISSGEEVPYLQPTGTVGAVTTIPTIAFMDAVLKLDVTPHITPDRKVKLLIDAKQDTVSTKYYNIGYTTEPGIDTRKIKTELLVPDGNVVVIGGIINNQSNYENNLTPGLASIPLFGNLFKAETNEEQKNELLIFISPKVVEPTTPYAKNS